MSFILSHLNLLEKEKNEISVFCIVDVDGVALLTLPDGLISCHLCKFGKRMGLILRR